jgi:hypothetical protein
MTRSVVFVVLFACCASRVSAQERGVDLFVGFPLLFGDGSQLLGWHATLDRGFGAGLGVTADLSGHYGEVFAEKPIHLFLVGPVVGARRNTRVTPFARALIGGGRSGCDTFDADRGCRAGTAFAWGLGAGLAFRAGDALSIRAPQADYLRTRFGGKTQSYVRVSLGLTFRLGRK